MIWFARACGWFLSWMHGLRYLSHREVVFYDAAGKIIARCYYDCDKVFWERDENDG